jgi:hypothetical protein
MKVFILNILKHDKVYFKTEIGDEGVANWLGNQAPSKKKWYDVEIDIDQVLKKNSLSISKSKNNVSFSGDEENIEVCGVVDSVDDDGMIYIRIQAFCLIMVESENCSVLIGEFIVLSLKTDNISLSPFSV